MGLRMELDRSMYNRLGNRIKEKRGLNPEEGIYHCCFVILAEGSLEEVVCELVLEW